MKMVEHDEKMAEIAYKHDQMRDMIKRDKASIHRDPFAGSELPE